jgi:hypothetical protein
MIRAGQTTAFVVGLALMALAPSGCKSGGGGAVRLGMSMADVAEQLGQPETTGVIRGFDDTEEGTRTFVREWWEYPELALEVGFNLRGRVIQLAPADEERPKRVSGGSKP